MGQRNLFLHMFRVHVEASKPLERRFRDVIKAVLDIRISLELVVGPGFQLIQIFQQSHFRGGKRGEVGQILLHSVFGAAQI